MTKHANLLVAQLVRHISSIEIMRGQSLVVALTARDLGGFVNTYLSEGKKSKRTVVQLGSLLQSVMVLNSRKRVLDEEMKKIWSYCSMV